MKIISHKYGALLGTMLVGEIRDKTWGFSPLPLLTAFKRSKLGHEKISTSSLNISAASFYTKFNLLLYEPFTAKTRMRWSYGGCLTRIVPLYLMKKKFGNDALIFDVWCTDPSVAAYEATLFLVTLLEKLISGLPTNEVLEDIAKTKEGLSVKKMEDHPYLYLSKKNIYAMAMWVGWNVVNNDIHHTLDILKSHDPEHLATFKSIAYTIWGAKIGSVEMLKDPSIKTLAMEMGSGKGLLHLVSL